jgi:DNA-binding NtrC family response regulator
MRESLDNLIGQMRRGGLAYDEAAGAFRKAFISAALQSNRGNACKTAAAMRVHRNTLARICSELELEAREFRGGRRSRVILARSSR